MDKDGHIFGTELEGAEDKLVYKTTAKDLLLDLKALMKEYYAATFDETGAHLKLSFSNGQKFLIFIEEIN